LIEAGPIVQLQISLSRVPWRIAPAWSILAGALAVAPARIEPSLALRVVAAVLVGDLVWGLLRRNAPAGSTARFPASRAPMAGLPYAQADAPLSRSVRALALSGVTWQGALAGLILALGGGLLLGLPAVALSVLALLISAVALTIVQRGDTPAICFALLDVVLPWTLGMVAAGWAVADSLSWQPLILACALGILQWGLLRAPLAKSGQGGKALAVGVVAVLVALVALRLPWAAAMSAVLLAPPIYWLSTVEQEGGTTAAFSARAGPWALVALFTAALSLR
jgi:hypothetical protein